MVIYIIENNAGLKIFPKLFVSVLNGSEFHELIILLFFLSVVVNAEFEC